MTERNRWIEACSALEIDLDAVAERASERITNTVDSYVEQDDELISVAAFISLDDLRSAATTALVFRMVKGLALKVAMTGGDTLGIAIEADALAAAIQVFVVDMADGKGLIAPLEEVNRG